MDRTTRRERGSRKWRLITIIAGLLLASAFWMPMVPGCNSPYVPAEEYADVLRDCFGTSTVTMDDVMEACVMTCGLLFPFVIGVLLAWAALCRWLRKNSWRIMPVFLLFLVAIFAGVMIPTGLVAHSGILSPGEIIGAFQDNWYVTTYILLIPPAVFVYCIWSLRLRRPAFWCHAFIVCTWVIPWFGFWWLGSIWNGDKVYYGLHLAMAMTSLLLLATISEAALATGWSWRQTLWQLITCRLRENPRLIGHCPECEYNLHGLTEQRCPECGRPFTFEELGMTADEIGFQAFAVAPGSPQDFARRPSSGSTTDHQPSVVQDQLRPNPASNPVESAYPARQRPQAAAHRGLTAKKAFDVVSFTMNIACYALPRMSRGETTRRLPTMPFAGIPALHLRQQEKAVLRK